MLISRGDPYNDVFPFARIERRHIVHQVSLVNNTPPRFVRIHKTRRVEMQRTAVGRIVEAQVDGPVAIVAMRAQRPIGARQVVSALTQVYNVNKTIETVANGPVADGGHT